MRSLDRVRERLRDDPARACLALLTLANVALIWTLPILVGQDLPQHLSYARILADYADASLPFQGTFVLPEHPQPYFTVYVVMAWLTHAMSVVNACRVIYTGYVVSMAVGFASLVKAVNGTEGSRRTPWTALFGALVVWNPVQCVGFLPFMLALPAVLFGAAALIRGSETRARRDFITLSVATAVTASLHIVAAGCLIAFGLTYALFRRSRAAVVAAVTSVGVTALTLTVWRALGEHGLAELPFDVLSQNVSVFGVWDGAVRTLGVHWSSFDDRVVYVVATVLGPLPRREKLAVGIAIILLVAMVVSAREREVIERPKPTRRLPYALAVLAFLLLTVATPASLVLPDAICLLDFRLYVLAFLFALALVDPRWFEPLRARAAIATFAAFVLALWARQLHGVAHEATAVLHLVEPLPAKSTVLALPFHDKSAYLDEKNSVTHYFPVYFTALHGGVTSLFWGKFSPHLPVGYRDGHEPLRPPDWDPSQFTRPQLLAASHVLVEWPDANDGDLSTTGAARLRDELAVGFTAMGCEQRWCLYGSPASTSGHVTGKEEALR